MKQKVLIKSENHLDEERVRKKEFYYNGYDDNRWCGFSVSSKQAYIILIQKYYKIYLIKIGII